MTQLLLSGVFYNNFNLLKTWRTTQTGTTVIYTEPSPKKFAQNINTPDVKILHKYAAFPK